MSLREEWLARNVECLRLGVAEGLPDVPHLRLPGVLTTANRAMQQAAVATWLVAGENVSLCPITAEPDFERIAGSARWRCLRPCSEACTQPIADGSRHYHARRYHSGAPFAVANANPPPPRAAAPPALVAQASPPAVRGGAVSGNFPLPILNRVLTPAVEALLAGGLPVRWSLLDEASQLLMWDSVHNSLEAGHLGAQPCFERL